MMVDLVAAELDQVHKRIAGQFARSEPRGQENCQVGTFLAYASVHGHALIDRELYLPQSWAGNRDRCGAAGVPDQVEFTTKPRQAQAMISRTIGAGVPFAWFTADEAYGQAKYLQVWLEDQDVFYVVAIRCSDTLTTSAGEQRADALIAAAPSRAWQRLSVGAGAHGPREYPLGPDPSPDRMEAWTRVLAAGSPLHRRPRLSSPTMPATVPAAPAWPTWPGPRQPLACGGVLPAGQGRGRARSLPGPNLAGLVCPHHLVDARAGLARGQQGPGRKRGTGTSDPGMIGYTLPEIRRLLISLIQACAPDPERVWSWSRWRRRRQHQARLCHYRRRGYQLT